MDSGLKTRLWKHCIRCTSWTFTCELNFSIFHNSVRNNKTVKCSRLHFSKCDHPVLASGWKCGRNSLPADVGHAEDTYCHQTPQPSGILVVSRPHLDDNKRQNGGMLGGEGEMEKDFSENTVEVVSVGKLHYKQRQTVSKADPKGEHKPRNTEQTGSSQ